jgi:hypothetical protein
LTKFKKYWRKYQEGTKFSIIIILFSVYFISCSKSEIDLGVDPLNSVNFTSFQLERKNNPSLDKDVTFKIGNDYVEVTGLSRYYPVVVPSFTTKAVSITIDGQEQKSGVDQVDLRNVISYVLTSSTGEKKEIKVRVLWDSQIAQLNIQTKGNAAIASKQNYVEANLNIDGKGYYQNFKGECEIRGRGNSTWSMPKKPFKIKLKEDAELAGMASEKDWVLLANYLDGTHLLNAVAFKIGQQLQLPFTNHAVPVEVSVNNTYLGLYTLTEQIEVKKNRVNVGNDGQLLQLDSYYDEPWKFRSGAFGLPIQVMDPEISSQNELSVIEKEFNNWEALIASPQFPGNNYTENFDISSFANYFLVCLLSDNGELTHPKSTFMHKTKNGKYVMGPIWDFDWAYGYEGTLKHFSRADHPILWNSNSVGHRFFSKLIQDPKVKSLIKQYWAEYQSKHFNELLTYIDQYAFLIEGARQKDFQIWTRGSNNFKSEVQNLKNWLHNRSQYVTTYVNSL